MNKFKYIIIFVIVFGIFIVNYCFAKAVDSGQVQIDAYVPEYTESQESKQTEIQQNEKFLTMSGQIDKFYTDHGFNEYKSLTFVTEFQNTGEQDLKPHGYIIIKNWFGKEIERLDFNQQGMVSPVNKITIYKNIWSPQNLIGVGKYSADLVINYGTTENLTAQIHFWIFPWKVVGITLSFLILLWLIYQLSNIKLTTSGRVVWKRI